jgi:type IV secretion system protein VirD4
VFSGLITKLNPWLTDQVVALTETTDIDLDALATELFTFYVAVPSRSRDSKLLGSLIVNFLIDTILKIRERMKHPVTMLLDEFTNFGKISGIEDVLGIIRKNKIGLILGFQNYYQLEQVYGKREAQVIVDMPATQVYFKQKNFAEAKNLAEAIGRTTVESATINDSGRVHEILQGRHLITPDELISLTKEVVVFTADTKPIRLPLTSPTAYEHALSYEPPERKEHEISEFILNRGQMVNSEPPQPEPKKEPPQPEPQKKQKTKNRERPEPPKNLEPDIEPVKPEPKPRPDRRDQPPEYDDI